MGFGRKFVLITRLVMRSARVGFTRIWTCSVAPEPLWVSPMIQRTVSPAATGPEPTSCSPGRSAMSVVWQTEDSKGVVEGKSGSVSVGLGGRGVMHKIQTIKNRDH